MGEGKIILQIVGILTSEEFQKCKFYAQYLHKHLPKLYAPPVLRPMLDVQWTEFLTQCRRNYGLPFWMLKVPVAVFKNGEFYGDDIEFVQYCQLNFQFYICKDFGKYGLRQLKDTFDKSEVFYFSYIFCTNFLIIMYGVLLSACEQNDITN